MTGPLMPYAKAMEIMLAKGEPLGVERLGVALIANRVLAEPITSHTDMPVFDNSAVDGYAVRAADVPGSLCLVGAVRAGDDATVELGRGETIQVFTGAMIPPGADAVVMVEDTVIEAESVVMKEPISIGENIRFRGEELRAGTTLLNPGVVLSPPALGLAAGSGMASFHVYLRPRIGILTTGDELVEPGTALAPGQNYATNGYALAAAVRALGLTEVKVTHAADNLEATVAAIQDLLAESDVLLTSGGVSVGAHDHVKAALEQVGVKQVFWGVAVKPGQPFFFGELGAKLVFGLPGNPVSSLACYFMLVKPVLFRIMGRLAEPPCEAILAEAIDKKIGRLEFVRGILGQDGPTLTAAPLSARGSHMMGGLAAANCLIHVSAEADQIPKGTQVRITRLDWN